MNPAKKQAAEKAQATRRIRKADTGCECHSLPMYECPDFKPEIYNRNKFGKILSRIPFYRSARKQVWW